jgi:predicted nucleic acid-binding protein
MVIALDSNVFIAALSPNEQHSSNAQKLIRDVANSKHKALASSIIYGEVLSVSTNDQALDLEDFFSHIDNLVTIPATDSICLRAGELRLEYGSKLKLPDAMHLATALISSIDLFITNDEILAKVAQKLIPIKLLSEYN